MVSLEARLGPVEVSTNIFQPSDYDPSGCPAVPVSFSAMTGRLGNMVSTYTNFIALQWRLGYK